MEFEGNRERNLDMTVEENRLTSFSQWPRHLKQTPELLARAGFYHYGNAQRRDRVKCAYCKGRLYDWKPGDDPWLEHARCFPRCHYVRLCMGEDIIDDVHNSKRVHQSQQSSNVRKPTQPYLLPSTPSQADPDPFDLDMIMQSVPVQAVLQMGFSEEHVRQAVDERLKREGRPVSTAEELASLVIEKNRPTARKLSLSKTSETENYKDEYSEKATGIRMEEENEILKERYLCKICMEDRVRVTFLPCGHLVCCEKCASSMEECPICRSRISEAIRTFY